jgi:cytochrome P450
LVGLAVSPHRALPNLYRRFGPVCTVGFGPLRYVYLLGPEANRFVLSNSELFGWREAFDSLVVVDGETALIVSEGPDHQRRRRLVAPAFGRHQVQSYVQTMRANADAAIATWRPGQLVNLYDEMRRVIRRSTIEVLFGSRLAQDEPELGKLLQRALDVIERPPPWQQLQRLGAPSWRRAVAARAIAARRVLDEIEHCRTESDRSGVLSFLVGSRDEDDLGLTDEEIVDQVISLIAAGYHTTSAAMASATLALLTVPQRWDQATASLDDGEGWRYLDGVVSETLRLYPPAVVSARWVIEPFQFAGVKIPAGRMLLFSPYVTHRMPELWSDPLQFDPSRWNPLCPGYRRPAPYEYLPFGGGPHRCLGAELATAELTVLLEQLLRRATLRLESADPTPVGLAAMRPRRGPHARVLAIT